MVVVVVAAVVVVAVVNSRTADTEVGIVYMGESFQSNAT